MAEAFNEEVGSAHGDSLEVNKVELYTSPLLNMTSKEPNTLDVLLGRAPRKLTSPHSIKELSPSSHQTRFFEVIPAENRTSSSCRSATSCSDCKIINLECGVLQSEPSFEDGVIKSSMTSLSTLQKSSKNVSSVRSMRASVSSSPVDEHKHSRESRHSSGTMSWALPLRLFSSKKTNSMGLDVRRLPKGIR
ncbi:hypothetical protein ElyMa_001688300 [Elysia marginata]|uniref:Uncharacterized protein n=1 Tax=Elysia marginata TaxID=1093978 RepID=A0AAV4JRR3_9GAST|nr:hypothetical protein ElyMa_001688300 [Elysia marginata]